MAENPYELTEEEKKQLADQLYYSSVNPYLVSEPPETREELIEGVRDIAGSMQYGPSAASQIGDILTSGYNILPDPIKSGIGATGQGAKVVGSKFMDVLAPLDKPRGALAGAWEELGPEEESVTDDRSMARRIWEGMGQGWREPSSKSYFPEEIRTDLAETGTAGTVASVAGDIAANIAGDPLTWTPAAVVSVPYKLIKGAGEMIAATRPAQAAINAAPVRTVLEAFNVYVGDAGKAKRIMDDLRRQQRGANILSDREEFLLNEELAAIATRAGVSVPELKSALLQDVEAGALPSQVDEAAARGETRIAPDSELAAMSDEAVGFAEGERKYMSEILAEEKAAGLEVEDIMRLAEESGQAERAAELGVGGFYPHVLGEGATLSQKVGSFFNQALPYAIGRGVPGTIREINEARGRTTFMDDPLVLRTLRKKWSRNALFSNRMLDKLTAELGTKLGKAPEGYVQPVGRRKTLFDEEGNPLPADFIKIDGHAIPAEAKRILDKQLWVARDPKRLSVPLKAFDEVQRWWKKYALALRPAWHSRNAFSNFWNNWFIGGLTNPARYGQAAAVQKAMQYKKGDIVSEIDRLAGRLTGKSVDPSFKVPGTGMTREEIWEAAVNSGIYEAGLYGTDIEQAALRGASNIPGATEWKGINKAFAAGKTVENNARMALFIDRLAKGDNIEDAAQMVRKSLFDYADLSPFEKQYMKRIFPFYTWTRKNIPAQLHAVLQHPDRANKINIIVGGIQRDVPKINDDDIEMWVKDQFPVMLSGKQAEDTHTFITAMSYLPTAELNKIFTNPKSFGQFVAQMGTPLLKVPLEILMNWDSFREKPIDFMEHLGKTYGKDWGEGFFKSVPGAKGSESFLGVKMTPKQKHLAQAIVLLGEIDRANPLGLFGEKEGRKSWAGAERTTNDISPAARLIRAAIGARIYQREKGAKAKYEGASLAYEMTELSNLLGRSRVARNPELVKHVMSLIEQAMGR
jgi:hypothetical protein